MDEMERLWTYLYTEEGAQNSGFNSYFKVAVIKRASRMYDFKTTIDFHERLNSSGEVEGYYRHEFKKVHK